MTLDLIELLRISEWAIRRASSLPPGELRGRALVEAEELGDMAAGIHERNQQALAMLAGRGPIRLGSGL